MPPTASPHRFVRFDHVRISYDGGALVVRDLSLDITHSKFGTLPGPSGSGKTTSLMMLAGFERPDAGKILFEGRTIAHTSPYCRDIGVVFQNFALSPHMTVPENISLPLRVRHMGSLQQRELVKRPGEAGPGRPDNRVDVAAPAWADLPPRDNYAMKWKMRQVRCRNKRVRVSLARPLADQGHSCWDPAPLRFA